MTDNVLGYERWPIRKPSELGSPKEEATCVKSQMAW